MADGSFATAINCMDGRTQKPVTDWLTRQFGVEHIDTITEPGVDKVLTQGALHQVQSIKDRVLISVNAHGSRHVVVVGHHDCAGNPVSRDEHHRMTREAVEIVAGWDLPIRVFGLWVDENWNVEVIHER
jgi:hypothetical protein